MQTTPQPRHPDEILNDFDQAVRGLADIDSRELIFELIDDLRASYRLAIELHVSDVRAVAEIEAEISDYIANHYGDG
ncbi:hypothetical protein ABIE52_006719 [Rhodococcus sp. OAS809]|uniref:hypothetical protein n=1 Tax=Rhodococcus sp. OAS809 TaxID=2663874 RepID=UPI00178B488B